MKELDFELANISIFNEIYTQKRMCKLEIGTLR